MSEIDKQPHSEGYTGNKKNNFNGYATKVEADAAAFINTRFPEENATVKVPTESNTVETGKYQYSGATFYSKEEIDNLRKKQTEASKWLHSNKYAAKAKIIFVNKPKDQKIIERLN